ncbi:MAG: hypothetical protein WBO70_08085 [Erysipelotrichaceae bacterium]
MKKIIYIMIIAVFMTMSSCANNAAKTYLELDKYGIKDDKLSIIKLSYNDFKKKDNDKIINGLVFIVRSTCDFCPYVLQDFSTAINNNSITKDLYAVDSDEMSQEEKLDMVDKYGITSVPTIVIYDAGIIKSIEIGNINDDIISKLVEFVS